MGIYTIGNIGTAALLDKTSGAIKMPFDKMDEIMLTLDGTMTKVPGGAGMLPAWTISADRKPMVEAKGSEIPFDGMASILGANFTAAAAGSPIVSRWLEYKTISAGGTVTLDNPISATNLNVSIVGGGTTYTGVASAPTTGEYITPIASATSITFATADAGKTVTISYHFDTTTGVQIDYMPTSIPGEYQFVSTAKLKDAEGGADVPCTFIVNRCQLDGTWNVDQQRMKASATDLKFTVLDPGGSTPAVSIIPLTKFLQ